MSCPHILQSWVTCTTRCGQNLAEILLVAGYGDPSWQTKFSAKKLAADFFLKTRSKKNLAPKKILRLIDFGGIRAVAPDFSHPHVLGDFSSLHKGRNRQGEDPWNCSSNGSSYGEREFQRERLHCRLFWRYDRSPRPPPSRVVLFGLRYGVSLRQIIRRLFPIPY